MPEVSPKFTPPPQVIQTSVDQTAQSSGGNKNSSGITDEIEGAERELETAKGEESQQSPTVVGIEDPKTEVVKVDTKQNNASRITALESKLAMLRGQLSEALDDEQTQAGARTQADARTQAQEAQKRQQQVQQTQLAQQAQSQNGNKVV